MRQTASSEKPLSPMDFQITSTRPELDDPLWDGGFDCEAGTRDCLSVVRSACLRAAEEVSTNFGPQKFFSKPGVTN